MRASAEIGEHGLWAAEWRFGVCDPVFLRDLYTAGADRSQSSLFPELLEDWISEDNPDRIVDIFVDALDLTNKGFSRMAPANTCRPGYHPSVLLKLFIYGYLNRVPSRRRLEREANRNVEVMWLTGLLAPDHKTIADLRTMNATAIRKTCAQFVELCRRIGVLKGGCVAIDGGMFKAVNNRDRNFRARKIALRISHLEQSAARYLEEVARIDRREAKESRIDKATHLKTKLERVRGETHRLNAIAERLKDTTDGQISLTDPDARSMATRGKGDGLVGYNIQTAVDTQAHLIVAHGVTTVGNDRTQLTPMRKASKAAIKVGKLDAIADRGYCNGSQILTCDQAQIPATVPRPEASGNCKKGMFLKVDFTDDAEADIYIFPAGRQLKYRYTREEGGLQHRRYWQNECQHCPLKSRCTTGKELRIPPLIAANSDCRAMAGNMKISSTKRPRGWNALQS